MTDRLSDGPNPTVHSQIGRQFGVYHGLSLLGVGAMGDSTLMASRVSTTGSFSANAPEPLFEHPTLRIGPAPAARYGVSRNGQRFLTVETQRERETPIVRVVENWLPEFGRSVQKEKE